MFAAVKEYAALARANGMTPAQMALAWCYSRWFVASTIIGATSLAQLKENIDAEQTCCRPRWWRRSMRSTRRHTNPGQ